MTNVASARLMLENANPAIISVLAKNGATLSGIVQSRSNNGVVSLQTDFGNLNLKSDLFLKKGAELVIKIEQKQSDLIAKIISVNGLSPNKYQEIMAAEKALIIQDKVTTSSNVIENKIDSKIENKAVITPPQTITNSSPNLSAPQLRGVFLQQPKISPELLQQIAPTMNYGTSLSAGTALQLKIINILIPDDNINDTFTNLNNIATNNSATNSSAKNNVTQNNLTQSLAATNTIQPPPQPQTKSSQLTSPQLSASHAINATNTPNIANNSALPPTTPAITSTLVSAGNDKTKLTPLEYLRNILPNNSSITQAANPTTTAPNIFNGVVLHQANMRELTMQTDMGLVKLFLSTPLPKGSIIQFELLQLENVRGVMNGTRGALLQDLSTEELFKTTPTNLPTLEEMVELKHLSQIPTPAYLQPHIVPRIGATLANEMLFFLNALTNFNPSTLKQNNLQKTDAQKLLGDVLHQQLQSLEGGDSKLNNLNNEIGSLKKTFEQSLQNLKNDDPKKENWQSMLIPIYDGTQLRPIQLFMKKKQVSNKDVTQITNHFMLELELDNIGLMQLDGLVQQQKVNANNASSPKTANINFNMIIRTQQPWEDAIKADIINIFTSAQQITGTKGTLQFQHGKAAIIPHPDVTSSPKTQERSIIV